MKSLGLFIVCELIYLFFARVVAVQLSSDGILLNYIVFELWWTLFRFLSLIVLIILFRKTIFIDNKKHASTYSLWPVYLMILAIPWLIGCSNYMSPATHIYAATSIVVGFREEFAYRGILQKLITNKYGITTGLIISNVIFIFYHFGARPLNFHTCSVFFCMGMVFGLIFFLTGNIYTCALLHSIYDMVDCYSPYFSTQYYSVGYLLLFTAPLILLVVKIRKVPRLTK